MIKKIILLILGAALVVAVYLFFAVSAPAGRDAKTVYFRVESGESVKTVAGHLKENGLIKSPWVFRVYSWLKDESTKIKAGDHELSQKMSSREILAALISAKNVSNEKQITIIEGWRLTEMAEYLEKQGLVSKYDFLAATKIENWQDKYDFLAGVKTGDLEGFLFPDTYRVFKNASAEDIVKKMLDTFDSKLSDTVRQDIKKQNKTIFEIITLASIVEREARTSEDKKMVADVFWKRLAKNIGLQSDATVNFVTGKSLLRPTAQDLEIDSPYNTYKYRGLPPGPISNPGLESILAVVYPQANPYYFFLMDKDGKTHYGITFEDHQANIAKYLE